MQSDQGDGMRTLGVQDNVPETDLFFRVVDHLAHGDTLDEVLASAVELAVALVKCDECCAYVSHAAGLVPWVWKGGTHGTLERPVLPLYGSFSAFLRTHNASVISGDFAKDLLTLDPCLREGATFVKVPFISHSSLMGAMTLRHIQPRAYADQDLKLLYGLGCLLGGELRIIRLRERNSELLLELETGKLVERSKGILQRELGMSDHEAYVALQRQSQQKGRPMKEIAKAVILSAEVRRSIRPS